MRTALVLSLVLIIPSALFAQGFTEHKILASDGEAGDYFGHKVSVRGDVTVVNALKWQKPVLGAAYVYRGCGITLTETKLVGSDTVPSDRFGMAVATNRDLVVVGAPQDDSSKDGVGGNGAVYAFRWDGSVWVEEAKLTASNGLPEDMFGAAVAVDGDTIVVGALRRGVNQGTAYIFEYDGTQWTEALQTLEGSDSSILGFSVAIDGDVIALGAPYDSSISNVVGSVLMYRKIASQWTIDNRVVHGDRYQFDQFGYSVAVQGNRLLAGAPSPGDQNIQPGKAYLFEHDGTNWIEVQKLEEGANASDRDEFGFSVALTGGMALVGCRRDDDLGIDSGSMFVYRHDGITWNQTDKLLASDGDAGDLFGGSVAADGGRVIVGASTDEDTDINAGSAYAYTGPAFVQYGTGLAGSGGVMPSLDATGDATPGGVVTVEIRDFIGGALSVMLVGIRPGNVDAFGGDILIDVSRPWFLLPMALPGTPGTPGDGDLDLTDTVPPALSCSILYLQQLAVDAAAPWGVSMSNGLELFFGE